LNYDIFYNYIQGFGFWFFQIQDFGCVWNCDSGDGLKCFSFKNISK
jgi:hypothetical protein